LLTDKVSAAFEHIQVLKVGDCRGRPLPHDAIAAIETLADIFASEPAERSRIAGSVRPEFSFVFFTFAADAAVESVRQKNADLLARGLLALAIENLKFDARDTLRFLAQIYNSAQLLGVDASQLFAEIRERACAPFSGIIDEFLRRPEELRSTKAFHIRVTKPPQPFGYVVEWKPPSRIHKLVERLRDLLP
jgi:hypothetical protein